MGFRHVLYDVTHIVLVYKAYTLTVAEKLFGLSAGSFVNGVPSGHGRWTYKNGDFYDGDVLEGEKHGFGSYHCAHSQCQYVGTFAKGAFVAGRWLFGDGSYVKGAFQPGMGKNSFVPTGDAHCLFGRPGIQQVGEFQVGMKWNARPEAIE
jgi:hypothetical protein